MLKTVEASMQKDPNHVLVVVKTTGFKKKGKNTKTGAKIKPQGKSKSGPTKETECF